MDSDIRFGQADHLVSEALYLSDPDGNGIEIYRDRPRAEWTWRGGKVEMSVDPLDLDGLLQDAKKTTGSPRAPPDAAGLESFSIRVPSSDEQKRTTERLEEASIPVVFENGRVRARDPWNIGIEILAS